jgi:tRNA(Ile)-lysidine synthase
MNTPDTAALWQIRKAVKPWLENNSQSILFGCSGGADSMALALALFIESENKNIIPIVVDHGLQPESAQVTLDTVEKLKKVGYKQIETAKAQVIITDGLEASARRARYQIFNQLIDAYDAKYFLLAHTLNDQAENVLLGLARGSGTRSLSGMAVENNKFIRPLLKISRETTQAACIEGGVEIWEDPHNNDQRFTRVRVRQNVLPVIEENLGPKITEALARSSDLLRDDADALDSFANEFFNYVDKLNLEVVDLERLPKAIRTRVLRLAIYNAGSPIGSLTSDHIGSVESLVSDWHGQKEVALPGNVKVFRNSGRIILSNQ